MSLSSCQVPVDEKHVITMAHGSGGKQTSRLIEEIFLPAFSNDALALLHDGALVSISDQKIVFTTDSYVIWPIFFPGGDIGKLAIIGTLNDLAMCGAKPQYLSCSFIIEEGFLQSDLKRIVASMQEVATAHAVSIVTGDTKVIERNEGKNIYINTSGIGLVMVDPPITPRRIQEGDAIVISGDMGRHGMAVMAQRHGFTFSSTLESDCAPLFPLIEALFHEGIDIHCLRDLTRGGLATALIELSESSRKTFSIHREEIPVSQSVNSACEILGFDPLYVANEGRFVAFVPESQATRVVEILRVFADGKWAQRIGTVLRDVPFDGVKLKNSLGVDRPLYRLSGEQLPRIC